MNFKGIGLNISTSNPNFCPK